MEGKELKFCDCGEPIHSFAQCHACQVKSLRDFIHGKTEVEKPHQTTLI